MPAVFFGCEAAFCLPPPPLIVPLVVGFSVEDDDMYQADDWKRRRPAIGGRWVVQPDVESTHSATAANPNAHHRRHDGAALWIIVVVALARILQRTRVCMCV